MLMRKPGFTLVAILTLALGIGANTAIFSLINSVLIKPLAYPDPDHLLSIYETTPGGFRSGVSAGSFKDWRANSAKFSHIALYKPVWLNITGTRAPEYVAGLQVSAEFISALGVAPILGRGFVAGEDAIGGNNRVIVLAHELWRRRYGGDAGVIGQTVSLNQVPYTVIGVLPPGALLQDSPMFVIPFIVDVDSDTVRWARGYGCCGAVGRVAPGVTVADAQAELRGVRQRLAAEY